MLSLWVIFTNFLSSNLLSFIAFSWLSISLYIGYGTYLSYLTMRKKSKKANKVVIWIIAGVMIFSVVSTILGGIFLS